MRHSARAHAARLSFLLAALSFLPAATAAAQGAGIRGGLSVDPDQVYFGGHYETAPLVDRLHFRPNLEVGLGDDVTLIGVNMEFAYKFPRRNGWAIYAGGGPSLNILDRGDNAPGNGGSSTEGGLNLMVGAEQTNGLFFEFKVGVADAPDVKFGVGFTWR